MVYNWTEYILWWWGNIWEPSNLFAVATSNSSIDITWTDNNLQAIPPSTFQKSVLVRKVGSAPTSPSDWTLVVTETVMNTYQSSAYSDTGLTDGTTYYYQVFSYSTDWWITYWTPVSATPSRWWQPWVNTLVYYNINDNDTNSTIYDLSWNWVDQTWHGTSWYTTDATYGRVATFNGMSYTEGWSIINFGSECTFIALVNLNNFLGGIVIECASSSSYGVWLSCNCDVANTLTGWYSGILDGNLHINTTSVVSANQRVMVASTRASDWTAKIYINWVLDNTVTWMNNPTYTNPENLGIGRWRRGTNYMNGQFKLFIWENRTRTAQEIVNLATEYGFTVS